jgi:DNA replication and repair protein RecF
VALIRLGLRDFRCFAEADLALSPTSSLIVGPNASGKTSLLEAIHVLGQATSFRAATLEPLPRQGAPGFLVTGRLAQSGREVPIGVERRARRLTLRLAGAAAGSRADLAQALPVRVLDADGHLLLEGGPKARRRFLDWGVFHVERGFYPTWRRYQRALKQRNTALRQGASARALSAWNQELCEDGVALDQLRRRYLESLVKPAQAAVESVLGMTLGVELSSGWPADMALEQALAESYPRDLATGSTRVGPHRADLRLVLDGQPAASRVSRGQGKALAGALLAGQLAGFREVTGQRPTLLIDDLPAELDDEHLRRLWTALAALDAQTVVTAIREDLVPPALRKASSVFHVERVGASDSARVKVI